MTVFDEAWNVLKEDKQHEKKIIECLKKEGGAASLDDCAKECGVSKQSLTRWITSKFHLMVT